MQLVENLETFRRSNVQIQDERLSSINLLASTLQNLDAKNRATDLINKQEKIVKRIISLVESLQLKAVKMDELKSNGSHNVSLNYCLANAQNMYPKFVTVKL